MSKKSTVEPEKEEMIMKDNNLFNNDFDFKDNLSRLVKQYDTEELSIDELDYVYAARKDPSYSKFLEILKDKEK